MITASTFAHKYSSFWNTYFPAFEAFLRDLNSGAYEREYIELNWEVEPKRSAIVSETSFCLCKMQEIKNINIDAAFEQAKIRLRSLPGSPDKYESLSEVEKSMILKLSRRLVKMIDTLMDEGDIVEFDPKLPGCGILSSSKADIAVGQNLIEMKSVERMFRTTDFRQLLTYYFQSVLEGKRVFTHLTVMNPRKGILFSTSAEQLIYDTSGFSSVDIHNKFLTAVGSNGTSR